MTISNTEAGKNDFSRLVGTCGSPEKSEDETNGTDLKMLPTLKDMSCQIK